MYCVEEDKSRGKEGKVRRQVEVRKAQSNMESKYPDRPEQGGK
jgi:hypothetical protein